MPHTDCCRCLSTDQAPDWATDRATDRAARLRALLRARVCVMCGRGASNARCCVDRVLVPLAAWLDALSCRDGRPEPDVAPLRRIILPSPRLAS